MTNDSNPNLFAKLFNLGEGNQLVIYKEPGQEEPTLVMVTASAGVLANTRMTVQNEAPVESKHLALATTLEGFDESTAKKVFNALNASIKQTAPILSLLQEVREFVQGREQPFAKLLELEDGSQVLAIREENEGVSSLRMITQEKETVLFTGWRFDRDQAFDGDVQLKIAANLLKEDRVYVSSSPGAGKTGARPR